MIAIPTSPILEMTTKQACLSTEHSFLGSLLNCQPLFLLLLLAILAIPVIFAYRSQSSLIKKGAWFNVAAIVFFIALLDSLISYIDHPTGMNSDFLLLSIPLICLVTSCVFMIRGLIKILKDKESKTGLKVSAILSLIFGPTLVLINVFNIL